jgi:hypothetical protein
VIRPLAAFLRALDAARTAGTLARTVLVLSRQLDHAHILAASEEARADRAEEVLSSEIEMHGRTRRAQIAAENRIAELEAQTRDWAELSGELAREQPADDALPSVLDAGEAPIPLVLTDSAREADIRADVQRERAEQAERERDAAARAAGAHLATIERLREELADALRDAVRRSDEINAGTDDPPPTRPSERTTDNKEPRT